MHTFKLNEIEVGMRTAKEEDGDGNETEETGGSDDETVTKITMMLRR